MNEQTKQFIQEFFKNTVIHGNTVDDVVANDFSGMFYLMDKQNNIIAYFQPLDNWTPPTMPELVTCKYCGGDTGVRQDERFHWVCKWCSMTNH